MKKLIIVFILANFIGRQAFAQPANDDCTTAQNIGTLPTPAACPSGLGTTLTIAGTLVAATPGNPYIYQPGCTGAGGPNQSFPANDVWYSFVASGYQCVITINSTFANPNIAFYSGSCASLGGGIGGCAVGTGGTVTLTVDQMVIGTTYYLQISGNTTQTGTFNMIIKNSKSCVDCLNASTVTVSPQPINGMYYPGQTVNFCYHISKYTQVNTNWLHGIQLDFGAGWNLGSLTTTPPAACQGTGYWAYYPAGCTGSATGVYFGSGFYFETVTGQNNPSNNFGDDCSGNIAASTWNFCFSITVANGCSPGSNLSVAINTSGDGESGSWNNNGCTNDPATMINAVGACCAPTMASVAATCVGNDGTATATPVGSSGPYTYSWTNSGGTVISTTSGVAGSNTITGLAPGTYTVGITNIYNCLATNTVTVASTGSVGVPTAGSNSAICEGATLNLTAATLGGVTYSWAGPNGFTSGIQNPSITNATTAASGTYTVTATQGGCSNTSTVNVTINPLPVLTITNPASVCVPGTVDITAAAVTAGSTGSGTLSYWTNAGATTALATPTAVATSGTYYIQSATAAGCKDIKPVVVTISPAPVLTITNPPAVCSPNTVDLTAAAVTAGSTGAGTLSYWVNSGATTTLTNPNAVATSGTYYIKSTVGSCVDIKPVTVTVNPLPTLTITNPSAVCTPGTVDVTVAAVTAGSTGGGTLSYWTDASATTVLTTPAAVSASGTYYIESTTAAGCKDIKPVLVTINPLPVLTITNPAAVCSPLTVDITVAAVTAGSTGGGILTYWTDGAATVTLTTPSAITTSGTYYIQTTATGGCKDIKPVTVTINPLPVLAITNPAAVCSPLTIDITAPTVTAGSTGGGTLTYWTDGTATTALTSPAAVSISGTYYIQATTAGGCKDIKPITATINPLPVLTITNPAAVCPPLTVDITAAAVTAGSTGGGALTYWTDGTATTALTSPSAITTSGTYYIQTITVAGCKDIKPVTITINPLPILAIAGFDVTCNGYNDGQTIVIPSGATSPYTYSWTGGCNAASCTGLAPGSYTVIVTDFYGCVATGTTSVAQPTLLTISIAAPTPASCHGVCDGTATATGTGGTVGTGYTYSWNTVPVQTTAIATGLCVGSYTCTVTDANNCTATAIAAITEPPLVAIDPIVSPTICFGGSTVITAIANGGNGGAYNYTWSPATGLSATNIANPTATPAGTTVYTVNATDINGCPAAAINVTVTVNPPLAVIATGTTSICPGATTPLSATASNGSGGSYTYSWLPVTGLSNANIANPTASPAITTTYTVTANDGCSPSVTATVIVTINPLPVPLFVADNTSGCPPVCVNFIDGSTVASGTLSNWNWNFGGVGTSNSQNPSFCFTAPGQYNVTLSVTTNNGCNSISTPTVITVFQDPIAEFNPTPNPASVLDATVILNNQSSSDVNYWNWTFGDGDSLAPNTPSPTHTYPNEVAANYTATLIVRNGNGCYDTMTHEIFIAPEFTFFIPNAFSPNDDGTNDTFYGQGIGIAKYELLIFDRWGNLIFYADDINKTWDGKANHGSEVAQEDVYVWKVKLLDVLGKRHNYIGTVTIVK